MSGRILCQLKSDTGELLGAPIDLPLNVDKLGLEKLCQALLSSVNFITYLVDMASNKNIISKKGDKRGNRRRRALFVFC